MKDWQFFLLLANIWIVVAVMTNIWIYSIAGIVWALIAFLAMFVEKA